MIRLGEYKDVPNIVEMAWAFWEHAPYDEPFEPDLVETMAKMCIDNDMMAVLDIDGEVEGFACGVTGPLLASSQALTGSEIAWWVNPGQRSKNSGIALLQTLEELAKAKGVKYWNMLLMESSMPKQVENIYKKMGYVKTETTYSKVL